MFTYFCYKWKPWRYYTCINFILNVTLQVIYMASVCVWLVLVLVLSSGRKTIGQPTHLPIRLMIQVIHQVNG